MKKNIFILSMALVVAFVLGTATVQSQTDRNGYRYGMGPGYGYGYGMGPGMMGGYGGHGRGAGMMGDGWIDVPAKLPAPKSMEWAQKLREILTLEKESLAQYQTDQEKFNAYMPYMMVIPQEENHIEWIEQLFKAYALPADGKTPPVVDNKTLTDAYELSVKMENELLPRYEWLVKKAEDRETAQVLNAILIQSRWHLVMFDHALRMGHGYGFSRGWGMGPGMMGGYGSDYGMGGGYDSGYGRGPGMMGGYYGTGRGSGRQYPPTGKAIDAKEAEAMMNDYLKSSRNPNLKLGKIKDMGGSFEAEILTKKNDLVDRVHIDKATGYIRSAY
jgi:hypothetical protein